MLTNVVIVEDDSDYSATLAALLNETPNYRCVKICDSGEEGLLFIPQLQPDIILMDINLPKMSGIVCTRQLRELCPSIPILILTVYEDSEQIFGALKAGAKGYLLKRADPARIIQAIEEVKLGGAPMSSQIASRVVESFYETPRSSIKDHNLSQREEEVLRELAKGYTTKEIASRFSISSHTVHAHLVHIYDKLHVRSRTEAILKYLS
jgi:DNA-binding NarL/FixJ family response regulator